MTNCYQNAPRQYGKQTLFNQQHVELPRRGSDNKFVQACIAGPHDRNAGAGHCWRLRDEDWLGEANLEGGTNNCLLPGVAAGTANLWETEGNNPNWPKQLLPKCWFGTQKVNYWLRSQKLQPSVTHYQNTGAGRRRVFPTNNFTISPAGKRNR